MICRRPIAPAAGNLKRFGDAIPASLAVELTGSVVSGLLLIPANVPRPVGIEGVLPFVSPLRSAILAMACSAAAHPRRLLQARTPSCPRPSLFARLCPVSDCDSFLFPYCTRMRMIFCRRGPDPRRTFLWLLGACRSLHPIWWWQRAPCVPPSFAAGAFPLAMQFSAFNAAAEQFADANAGGVGNSGTRGEAERLDCSRRGIVESLLERAHFMKRSSSVVSGLLRIRADVI